MTTLTSDYYSTDEVAGIFGKTRKTIRSWCAKGKLPGAVKLPDADSDQARWYIPVQTVRDLRDQTVTAPRYRRPDLDELMRNALAKS